MIYGNISGNQNVLTESELSFKIINETIDMQYVIFNNTVNIVAESNLVILDESFKDKVNLVVGFIKKLLLKFKDFIVGTVRGITLYLGELLSYIPKLGRYTRPVGKVNHKVPKDGVDTLLKNVPKSLMSKINEYSNKSEEELESIDKDLKKHSEDMSNKLIIDAVKRYQPDIKDASELNIQYMLQDVKTPVMTVTELIAQLRIKVNSYKKKMENINKMAEDLCKSYNDDIKKIDSMSFSDSSDTNYDGERAKKDVLLLDIIRSEYAALFFVASKLGKAEFDTIQICARHDQELLNAIINQQKNGDFDRYKKSNKKEEENK